LGGIGVFTRRVQDPDQAARAPVADKRTSHGICEHHRRELEERVRLREEMRRQAERHDADVEDLRKNVDP